MNTPLVYVLDEILAKTFIENNEAQYLYEKPMGDKKVWVFADIHGKIKSQKFSNEMLFFTDKMTF